MSAADTAREEADALMKTLPGIYHRAFVQFPPMWERIATTAHAYNPHAHTILDLASGPGEPACTLAAHFPSARIVCSDSEDGMLDKAAARVAKQQLGHRVEVRKIDLRELAEALTPKAYDLITCSLALFVVQDVQACVEQVREALTPGGLLVGTVWEELPMIELGGRVVCRVFELEEPPPPPFDPLALSNGKADELLRAAHLVPIAAHNQVVDFAVEFGPLGDEDTWKGGMIGYMGYILRVVRETNKPHLLERVQEVFTEEVQAAGLVDPDGRVRARMPYRLLAAARADD